MATVKTCRHIMPTGRTCKSPAMRGAAYCYYHGPEKSPRRVSRATESELEIGPIADPADITFTAGQILQALASNRISKGRAAIMFQGLQTIMASYRIPFPDDSFDPDSSNPDSSDFDPFNPSNDFKPNVGRDPGPNVDLASGPIPTLESLLHHFHAPRAATSPGPVK